MIVDTSAQPESCYQFINSFYIKEKWVKEKKDYTRVPDALIIAYKKDYKSILKIIRDPTISFYVAKHDIDIPRYVDNLPFSKLDKVTVKYANLHEFLAEFNGESETYMRLKKATHFKSWEDKKEAQNAFISKIQANPRLFGSDIHIEDYYKMEFVKRYGSIIGSYHIMLYDIETDGMSDKHIAAYPINCMSTYDFPSDTMYTFVLDRPNKWDTFSQFKTSVINGSFEERLRNDPDMNGDFESKNNSSKNSYTNANTKYVIRFFTSEYDMIVARYALIHALCPDFCLSWNFSFDEVYTITRLTNLSMEFSKATSVNDIICDPLVPSEYRQWYFREDTNDRFDWYNKWHVLSIPGRTTYLCAMSIYANIRRSVGTFNSYGLNDTCIRELGKGKLDYHDIASSPVELPYKDFSLHIHYNIRDVWIMAELERKNHDVDAIMYVAEYTRLSKVTRVTSCIKNAQTISYEKQGIAIGNNNNVGKVSSKKDNRKKNGADDIDGAIVADPAFNEAILTPLYDYPSKTIRPYIIDNDLASMYPSIIISHNIYKTTLYFQMIQAGSAGLLHKDVGLFDINECMDNYQCNQPVTWGHEYLQLPNIMELVTALEDELQSKEPL